jgi:hypothetical protein
MAAHTEVLTDVPAKKVKQVVNDFKASGATVTKTKQDDGRFTITAKFPDE